MIILKRVKYFLLSVLVLLLLAGQSPAKAQTTHVMTFAGDSIMQGYGSSSAEITVVGLLGGMRPNWFIRNYSYGGASVSGGMLFGAPWPASDPNAVLGLFGDTTVVFLGTNDWAFNIDLPTFESNYSRFVGTVGFFGADVICVTPIWRNTQEGVLNAAGLTLDDYRAAISQVCGVLNLPVIDGLTMVPHSKGCFVDGVHPNATGYRYYAKNLSTAMGPLVTP